MTNFDKIKEMSIDELAEHFANDTLFLSSPCYVCPYDDGPTCTIDSVCTKAHRIGMYKKWLEMEAAK